jgi:hypothetical protein
VVSDVVFPSGCELHAIASRMTEAVNERYIFPELCGRLGSGVQRSCRC